jgi:hypothetical protein
MKLVTLIKMFLNETYSKVCLGKHLSDSVPIQKWSKTRRCFITTIYKVVWICHQFIMQLGKRDRVQLVWVPGHEGTDENEMADKLAKLQSECQFIVPEPACSISMIVARKAVKRGKSAHAGVFCKGGEKKKVAVKLEQKPVFFIHSYIVWRWAREPILPVTGYSYLAFYK